jgi:hypothetical protein
VAFQSYDELVHIASQNPKRAMRYVRKAQRSDRPVVSADNPGYGSSGVDPANRVAALRRMGVKKPNYMQSEQDENVQERKQGY